MKSKYFLLVLSIIFCFVLIACKNEGVTLRSQDVTTNIKNQEEIVEVNVDSEIVKDEEGQGPNIPVDIKEIIKSVTPADPRIGSGREITTVLNSFEVDLDGDGVNEKIELYTSAERDDDGEMMWDDGQLFLLMVSKGDAIYPLLNEYVQLGQVHFNVWYDVENRPVINTMILTGAGFSMYNYTYDKEEGGFVMNEVYNSDGINLMFSSIPSY